MLASMPRSRLMLAVPFVGKDVPSASSEFANPDVVIGLTLLAYRYEGMRQRDTEQLTQRLKVSACANVRSDGTATAHGFV